MKHFWKDIDWGKTVSYIITASAVVLVYIVLTHLGTLFAIAKQVLDYLSTFITGLVLAYIIRPAVVFFNRVLFAKIPRKKTANALSVALTILLLLGILSLILYAAIPQLVDSLTTLISNINNYYESFEKFIQKIMKNEFIRNTGINEELERLLYSSEGVLTFIKNWLSDNLSNIAGGFYNVGTSIVNVALAFVISIYLLLDWDRFFHHVRRLLRALFGGTFREKCKYFLLRSDYIFKGFIRCNLVDALIIGGVNLIVMTIFGMPYSFLISIIVGITNIIPTFGPIIGYVPSALLLVLIDPWKALWFTVLTVVLQMLDGNVIKPIVFKGAVGLPAVWVLVSIIVGASVGGVLGMLLAMPVTGILSFTLDHYIVRRLAAKDIPDTPLPSDIPEEVRQRKDLRKSLREMRKKAIRDRKK